MRNIEPNDFFIPLELDLSCENSIIRCFNEISSKEEKLDILINNAGYGLFGTVEDTSIIEAKKQFDVNLFGLARLTQLLLPHIRKSENGKLINISSTGGKIGKPHAAWYHASKYALEGLSDCLRLELKPFHVDVIIIEPGSVKTKWKEKAQKTLIRNNSNSPYSAFIQQHSSAASQSIEETEPNVVAQYIFKAILARSPRSRYVVGKKASIALFLHKYLGDRFFDKIILKKTRQI